MTDQETCVDEPAETLECQSEIAPETQASAEGQQDRFYTPDVIRRNMICLVLIDSIFTMGYSEFQMAMNPLYVYLGASNLQIGLVGAATLLGLAGVFLSPFVSVRFSRKKFLVFFAHMPYMGSLGAIGVLLLVSGRAQVLHQCKWQQSRDL